MKATNEFVLVIRDKVETETKGFVLPSDGKKKPNIGTIFSVGVLVKDGNIKSGKGKRCLFHSTVGWDISHEGVDYLVLEATQIISLV